MGEGLIEAAVTGATDGGVERESRGWDGSAGLSLEEERILHSESTGSLEEENRFLWEQLRRESEAKRKVLDVIRRREEHVDALKTQLRELEGNLAQERAVRKATENALQRSRDEQMELRDQLLSRDCRLRQDQEHLAKIQKQMVVKEEEKHVLEVQIDDLKTNVEEARKTVGDKEAQSQLVTELQDLIHSMAEEKEEMSELIVLLKSRVDELAGSVNVLVSRVQESNEELISMRLGDLAPMEIRDRHPVKESADMTPEELDMEVERISERYRSVMSSLDSLSPEVRSIVNAQPKEEEEVKRTRTPDTENSRCSSDEQISSHSPILYRKSCAGVAARGKRISPTPASGSRSTFQSSVINKPEPGLSKITSEVSICEP